MNRAQIWATCAAAWVEAFGVQVASAGRPDVEREPLIASQSLAAQNLGAATEALGVDGRERLVTVLRTLAKTAGVFS